MIYKYICCDTIFLQQSKTTAGESHDFLTLDMCWLNKRKHEKSVMSQSVAPHLSYSFGIMAHMLIMKNIFILSHSLFLVFDPVVHRRPLL